MNKDVGQEAFRLHTKIAENEEKRRALMIENILCLEEMREKELYKSYLGDTEAKWVSYLAQLEVFYTRSKIQRWIYIMQRLVKPYGIALHELVTLPESRLEDIARHANKENWEQLVEEAKVLTSTDWKITLAKIKGIDLENCQHEKEEVVKICNSCGRKHKIAAEEK